MRSLDDPQLLREIIMDHYDHPRNRGLVEDETYKKVNMNSDTCIDDLDIQVKFDGDKIADVRYDGEACACLLYTSGGHQKAHGLLDPAVLHGIQLVHPGLDDGEVVRVGVGRMRMRARAIFPVPTMPAVLPCMSNPRRPCRAKFPSRVRQ